MVKIIVSTIFEIGRNANSFNMTSRKCVNSRESFCYICGKYMLSKQQNNITNLVKNMYKMYFDYNIRNLEKPWTPNKVCTTCVSELRKWSKGKKNSFNIAKPMQWREPQDHTQDCYFCCCNVK